MSLISNRVKLPKKHELAKSHSQTQLLANKLRQEGVMEIIEEIMQGVEQVATLLAQPTFDLKISYKDSIFNLGQHLKIYGSYLEMLFEDQLNRAFIIFRNSSQDERIDLNSRLHLLELIELRAKRWKGSDQMNHYYKKKIESSESTSNIPESLLSGCASTAPVSPPLLNPGEVLKTSGKFAKPTRIPGKNYCKDEVVIRNADSGKVMGIKGRRVHMIEELSETIISFQRVNPGAKERLVQITGASEESINNSKQLIEDTIRRNASPVRDPSATFGAGGGGGGSAVTGSTSSINSSVSDEGFIMPMSMRPATGPTDQRQSRQLLHSFSTNDANIGEYKYTVVVNGSTLKIVGDNLDLVRISKLVLDEYFSGEPIPEMEPFYNFDSLPKSMEKMPIAPSNTTPSNIISNGKEETVSITAKVEEPDTYAPLRKPRKSVDEIVNQYANTSATNIRKSVEKILCYSIEYLARIAMSPLCLTPPTDWDRINQDYPMIVRKIAESFDANQYLSTRSGDLHTLPNTDHIDMSEI